MGGIPLASGDFGATFYGQFAPTGVGSLAPQVGHIFGAIWGQFWSHRWGHVVPHLGATLLKGGLFLTVFSV